VEWAIKQRGQKWYDDLKIKKNTPQKFIDADFDLIMQTLLGN